LGASVELFDLNHFNAHVVLLKNVKTEKNFGDDRRSTGGPVASTLRRVWAWRLKSSVCI